ncbi:MAG TPA: hypothetical protein VML55_12055 [Planctomycetaceae bacterium]|nr:hypothetical protein [Planctomycetaceae bacterium]
MHEALRTSLCGLKESLELLDGCGRVIGHFLPVQDRSMYAGVNSPTDREELLRRAREGGGRTWAEIRADLEQTA